MDKLRILQLSDIHNISCPKAMDPYKSMRKGLIQDIKAYYEHNQSSFDAILICGDIAFSGAKEEYDKSKEFIEKVCDVVDCKLSQVYVVPGNHDKNRKEGKPALRRLLNWGMMHIDEEEKMFEHLMEEESSLFSNLYLPFKHYLEFSKSFDNFEPIMAKCIENSEESNLQLDLDKDKMFWKSELTKDFHGYGVNLIGLNSALTCDEDDWSPDWKKDGHQMFLSVFAHNNLELDADDSINILMMHHPLDFIVNGDVLMKKFDKQFLLQFYGHIHQPDSFQSNQGGAVRVYSGAMQPPKGASDEEKKKYFPIYNIVELGVSGDDKKCLDFKLIVSKWNGNSFVEYSEQCKNFSVDLPTAPINRWKEKEKTTSKTLPQGVSLRDITCSFYESLNHKKLIEKMYTGMYDKSNYDYINCQLFLKRVEIDNRWCDLWNLLKS